MRKKVFSGQKEGIRGVASAKVALRGDQARCRKGPLVAPNNPKNAAEHKSTGAQVRVIGRTAVPGTPNRISAYYKATPNNREIAVAPTPNNANTALDVSSILKPRAGLRVAGVLPFILRAVGLKGASVAEDREASKGAEEMVGPRVRRDIDVADLRTAILKKEAPTRERALYGMCPTASAKVREACNPSRALIGKRVSLLSSARLAKERGPSTPSNARSKALTLVTAMYSVLLVSSKDSRESSRVFAEEDSTTTLLTLTGMAQEAPHGPEAVGSSVVSLTSFIEGTASA